MAVVAIQKYDSESDSNLFLLDPPPDCQNDLKKLSSSDLHFFKKTIDLSSAHAPHVPPPPPTKGETKLPQDSSEVAIKQPRRDTFRDECQWLPPNLLSVLSYGSSQLFFPASLSVSHTSTRSVRPRNKLTCCIWMCSPSRLSGSNKRYYWDTF